MTLPDYKVANILDTGYPDGTFDGVVAHAVIDHLTTTEAGKAIEELLRITVVGGLIMISFDEAEPEDFTYSHEIIELGTMLYKEGDRNGMIFHPYEWEEIGRLLRDCKIIYRSQNRKNEKIVIIKK